MLEFTVHLILSKATEQKTHGPMDEMITADKDLVLTQYPLLEYQRKQFADKIDENVEFLVVSTFAPRGYLGLVATLRNIHCKKVYIMLSEDVMRPMRPILTFLAGRVKADERFTVYPNYAVVKVTWRDIVSDYFGLFAGSFAGFGSMLAESLTAIRLLKSGRIRARADIEPFQMAYLRTNLWLGVQAGGAVTHTKGIISAAQSCGQHVTALSPDNKGIAEKSTCTFSQISPNRPYVVPREINHFSYNRHFTAQAKIKLHNFRGYLYQRTAIGSLAGVRLSRHFKLPLILEYNGSEIWMAHNWGTPFLFGPIIDLVERVTLRHAHAIVTVSDTLRKDLIERAVDPARIIVEPNGVDPKEFDSAQFSKSEVSKFREALGVAPDTVLVSFVGTFGPWHGAELLAEAALQLRHEGGNGRSPDLCFMFVGDGVRLEVVRATLSELIQDGSAILTGLVAPQDVPLYLAASDILVSSTAKNPDNSEFFGSPTKLFEYMASGRPVIASRIGQIGNIMKGCPHAVDMQTNGNETPEQDVFGVRVEPGDIDELTRAIVALANDAKWRQAAGDNARRLARDKYSWIRHFKEVYARAEAIIGAEATRKTRVLINALHSRSGGGITYLLNILPLLAKDDRLDLHIVLHKNQRPLIADSLNGVRVHVAPFRFSFVNMMLYEQIQLPTLERKLNADVVFSPANYGPLFARNSVLLLRNALSVAFVERRLGKLLYWVALYVATALSIFRSRGAISVSKYAETSAAGGLKALARTNFCIIPHGINERFKPMVGGQRSSNKLLAVSDLYVQKNLHKLLEAFAQVLNVHPGMMLFIAGAPIDKVYAARLHGIVDRLGIGENVSFLGPQSIDDLIEHYQTCTLFVFPSSVETFGNPLVEAMSCGAPIATSRAAAMPEVAGDGAVYFDPHDANDIARVLIDLLSDRALRQKVSTAALERAKMYSWRKSARALADVLMNAARC